jgi:3-oxoacyl-[acyl-carrier protein] reductase
LGLNDKVVLITGATRGIGWACARLFGYAGAMVIVSGRDQARADKRAAELRASGYRSSALVLDVTDSKQIQESYRRLAQEFGRLEVLVNNAGILQDALLGMIPDATLRQTFAVNSDAVILNMQQAARLMQRAKKGSIVNLTSIIGRAGNQGQVVYGASKAAVIGATLSAAKELAPFGIRVNAVAPGFIDTDMTRSLPEEKYRERIDSIKMKRIGTPEDVAKVVVFVASDLASYVTGQVIGVDGGMLI